MNQDEAKKAAKEHGSKAAAARALGIPKSTFADIYNGKSRTAVKKEEKTVKGENRDLAFRRKFDKSFYVPDAVRSALNSDWMKEKKWCEDIELQRHCNIGNTADWKLYARENNELAGFRIELPGGKIAWGHTAAYAASLQRKVIK